MYDSSGIFRISPSVHPPQPLYIFQWIDCKYLFVRARRQEEAWRLLALLDLRRVALRLLALLDLRRVALRPFFLARCLALRDQLCESAEPFFPFLSGSWSFPFFCSFLNVWTTLSIYSVYRSSLLQAALWGFPENLLRLYQTNRLLYLFSSFYSSGKFHHQ